MLGGLADEAEPVRDASMRAAQAVIATYREASAGLLLPPLQAGLTDANYRIRQSSAELLGELMLRLTDSQPMAILEKGEENAPDSPLASIAPAAQHALLAASRRRVALGRPTRLEETADALALRAGVASAVVRGGAPAVGVDNVSHDTLRRQHGER